MFLHRYSRCLGLTVTQLKATLTRTELIDALAYDRIDPGGEWRADLRHAQLMALLANIHRKSNSRPFTHDEFMPVFSRPSHQQQLNKKIRSTLSGYIHRPAAD